MSGKLFKCNQCGDCCRNLDEKNAVLLLPEDIANLSTHLKLPVSRLRDEYLEISRVISELYGKTVYQLRNDHGRCLFLDRDNLCTIYSVQPTQCRLGPTHFMSEKMRHYDCMKGIDLINTDKADHLFFSKLLYEENDMPAAPMDGMLEIAASVKENVDADTTYHQQRNPEATDSKANIPGREETKPDSNRIAD